MLQHADRIEPLDLVATAIRVRHRHRAAAFFARRGKGHGITCAGNIETSHTVHASHLADVTDVTETIDRELGGGRGLLLADRQALQAPQRHVEAFEFNRELAGALLVILGLDDEIVGFGHVPVARGDRRGKADKGKARHCDGGDQFAHDVSPRNNAIRLAILAMADAGLPGVFIRNHSAARLAFARWLKERNCLQINGLFNSHETIRINIHADPHTSGKFQCAEPLADHVLHIGAATGVDQQTIAITPPQ